MFAAEGRTDRDSRLLPSLLGRIGDTQPSDEAFVFPDGDHLPKIQSSLALLNFACAIGTLANGVPYRLTATGVPLTISSRPFLASIDWWQARRDASRWPPELEDQPWSTRCLSLTFTVIGQSLRCLVDVGKQHLTRLKTPYDFVGSQVQMKWRLVLLTDSKCLVPALSCRGEAQYVCSPCARTLVSLLDQISADAHVLNVSVFRCAPQP